MRKITEYLHAAAGRTLRRCNRSDSTPSDTPRRSRVAGDATALPFKRKLLMEALEPRLLLSADLMPVAAVPVLTAVAQLPQAWLEARAAAGVGATQAPEAALPALPALPAVNLAVQAEAASQPLPLNAVGAIEGGARLATQQSGSLSTAPADMPSSVRYAVQLAEGQLLSVVSTVNNRGWSDFFGRLQLIGPDGETVVAEAAEQPLLALQGVVATEGGTYEIVLSAERNGESAGHPGNIAWVLHAAVDALLETEDLAATGDNDQIGQAQWLDAFRVLPLPDAQRTAVVGKLTPRQDQGRTGTDIYAISLAAGESIEAISTLSAQFGYLQLLDSSGRQVAAATRVGESANWDGPVGLSHFVADTDATYYLRAELYWDPARQLVPIDYTLVVARNLSLDPDNSDELGLAQGQLGAITNGVILEQAEGALAPQGTTPQHEAYFEATATAATVRVTVRSIADASLGSADWTPALTAYDDQGQQLAATPVAVNDGWAWDVAAGVGARLGLAIGASADGQFLLAVDGAQGENAAPAVRNSSFDSGLVSGINRWQSINFTEAIRTDRLQPATLLDANGNSLGELPLSPWSNDAGASVQLPAGLAEGSYTLVLAAGALQDLTGQLSAPVSFSFNVDNQLPTLTSQTPVDQGELGADQQIRLTFSEPMANYWPSFNLYDAQGQQLFVGMNSSWSEDRRTVTIQLFDLPAGGSYEVRFEQWVFRDLAGNSYDSDPSTTSIEPLVLRFSTDSAVFDLPALAPREPHGSLVYGTSRSAALISSTDIDEFRVDLQAGQAFDAVISAALGQSTASLPQVELTVIDPDGVEVASVESSQAGRALLLPGIAVTTSGTWTLRVSSPGGETGSYSVGLVVGADVQREFVEIDGVQQPGNHTRDHAEDLDRTSIVLGDEIDRLASVGRFSPGIDATTGAIVSDWDFFRFTLQAGQTASIVVAVEGDAPVRNLRLGLFDDSGDLATSSGVLVGAAVAAPDADRAILDFTNHGDSDITLYARPRAESNVRYSMVVTRGATFDVGPVFGLPQWLGPTGAVLGALDGERSTGVIGGLTPIDGESVSGMYVSDGTNRNWYLDSSGTIRNTEESNPAFDAGHQWLIDGIDGPGTGGQYFGTEGGTLDAAGRTLALESGLSNSWQANRKVYVSDSDGFVRYLDQITNHADETRSITLRLISDLGSDGETQLVATDSGNSFQFDSADQWLVTDDIFGGDPAVAHVLWGDGGLPPSEAYQASDSIDRRWVLTLRPGETASLLHFTVQSDNSDQARQTAERLVGLPDDALQGLSAAERASIVNFNTGRAETYRFWATEGDALSIGVQALADRSLPFTLRLFGPDGNLRLDTGTPEGAVLGLSTGLQADASGAWTVQLLASGAQGEYLLQVDGATGAAPALQVVSSQPGPARPLSQAPGAIDVSFDRFVRSDSVQASDLELDDTLLEAGISVTGVEVLSGNTLRFRLSAGSLPEGDFGWRMAAGAVVGHDGQGNLAATGSFSIDRTGPQILDHGDAMRRANFNSLVFSFDQPIDAASASTVDVVSFTGPAGSDLRNSVYAVQVDGGQLTVWFYGQTTPGDYTLVLGPGISDLAGNLMDQDQDGTPGEAVDDRYTAVVTVADADLVVTNVQAPTEATLGQAINVQWTVRNDGALGTLAGRGWYDRVRLLDADGVEAYSTYMYTYWAQPLEVGATYTQSMNLVLPFEASIPAGDYRVEVVADGFNYLGEQNNDNNSLQAAAALTISVPAVADLVINNIAVPASVGSGVPFTVSWEVLNQGEAANANSSYVFIELVDLNGNPVMVTEYYEGEGSYTYRAYENTIWTESGIEPGSAIGQTVEVGLPWNLTPGQYRFRITADAYSQVPELAGESNNVVLSEIVSVEQADLRVAAVTAPTEAVLGQPITVTWQVANDGTVPINDTYVYDRIDLIDVDTGTVAHSWDFGYSLNVDVGASVEHNETVTLPLLQSLTGGNYRVRVTTDIYNYLGEADEDNNRAEAEASLDITVPPLPDVVASQISVPVSVAGNTNLTVQWTTLNQGTAATEGSFRDRLYLQDAQGNLTYLGDSWFTESIAASGSVQRSATFLVPHTLVPGSYLVRIDTDHGNNVGELLGDNNNTSRSASLELTTALVADLVVQSITAPAQVVLGQALTITWVGHNQGNAATTNGWYDRIELVDAAGTVRHTDYRFISLGAVQAGATYNGSVTFTPPVAATLPEGDYHIRVTADGYNNRERESNDSNNMLQASAAVPLVAPDTPDLVVDTIVVPAQSSPANTRVTLTWDEVNQGEAASTVGSASYVELINSNGSRVFGQIANFASPAGLAVGDRVQRSFELVLPTGMAPGDYRARITVDYYGQVQEYLNEGNNTTTSATFAVTEAIRADLTNVRLNTAVASPQQFGNTLRVDYSVDNSGPGSTQNVTWTDNVQVIRVSDGAVVAGVNVSAGNASGVPAGDSYTRTVDLTLPIDGQWAAGAYRLQLRTDINGRLNESDRSDNNLLLDLQIDVPALANLVAADVTVNPTEATAGRDITVSWTDSNTGNGAQLPRYGAQYNYFHDRVYLADSSGSLLRNLGEYRLNTPLAAGDSLARVQQLTLPDDIANGSYMIVVLTDVNDYINEHAGEADNRATSAVFTVTQPPRVDLQADAVVLPATEAETGAPITLQWVTRNAGQADFAGSFNEVVQVSTSADFSADVRVLTPTTRFTGTITAGGEVQRSAEVLVPIDLNGASTTTRTWYVRVVADNSNEVYEYAFETNNASPAASINFSRPALPDLQVDAVDADATAVAGTSVVVTYTVSNHGSAAAGARDDRIMLAREDGTLWSVETVVRRDEPLAAGASQTLQAHVSLPLNSGITGYSGRLRAVVTTDWRNEVLEYPNDGNNSRTDSDLVDVALPALPDLTLGRIVAPAEALTEAAIPLRWTVNNSGSAATAGGWTDRVWLTRNGVVDGSSRLLGDFAIDTILPAGASIERVQTVTLPRDTLGTWTIVVISDFNNRVFEGTGETGNLATDEDSITLIQRPLPNLVVSSVTPPQNAFSGQSAIVRWTVANTGDGATTVPLWRDAVYLSADDQFDSSDLYLGAADNPGYLEAGSEHANQLTVTLPRGVAGNYRFFVVADVNRSMYEGNAASGHEADNTSAPALTPIALTPPPDLVVRNITAPLQVFSGEPLTVSWTVLNDDPDGRTRESVWADRVWLSTDTTLDNADIRLGDLTHVGALDPLESYTAQLTADLPIGLTGSFHLLVATDIHGQVYENTADGNNTSARETATDILLTPPPDLEIVDVDAPESVRAGTELVLHYRVENLGATDVPGRQSWWSDAAWLSLDDTIDASDLSLGELTHYGALPVEGSYDATLRFTLPSHLAERSDYRLILRTDSGNNVFESAAGDANNTLVLGPVSVYQSRPDLVVSSLTLPAAVEAGRTATFEWTVSNQGDGDSIGANWTDSLWVSLDDEIGDGDDVLIGSVAHAGVLAPQDSYSVRVAPVLPFALVGNGRFYLRTDAGAQITEANEANNRSALQTLAITRQDSDLQVSDAVVTPVEGNARSFDLRFTVTNTGVASTHANAWADGIWLSADAAVGAGDVRVANISRSNPLAAGERYTVSTRITVPAQVAAGNFRVLVRADDNNAVIEGNGEGSGEANNTAAASVSIGGLPPQTELPIGSQEVPQPDLTVLEVDAPTSAFSGQSITIGWTVRNQGEDDANTGQWWASGYDQVYLSEDAFLDNSDLSLGYASFGHHAAGADVQRSLTANLPVGRSGLYYVLVKADAGNRVPEPDAESNNLGQSATLLRIDLAPPADLVAGAVDVPADAVLGANMAVTYTVHNLGSFAALGNWRDMLYLSTDDTFDSSDVFFGAADVSGPVAGGGSYSRTVQASLPGVNPGAYKLIVRSDVRNMIAELSEANNLSASVDAVELDVPELTLGQVFNGSFSGGQSQYFKVRVAADEALRFTLDGPGDDVAHDMFVGFNSVPTRSQNLAGTGELFTPDPVLTIPSTEAGVYYLRIDPSPQGSGAFSLQAGLVPFSLDRVRESTIGNRGEATVRIDGTLFNTDTRFELVGADDRVYSAVELNLKDAGRAFVTFDLFGATAGSYTLRALRETAGGSTLSATLSSPVQVVDGVGADAFLTINGPTAVQVNRTASFTLNYSNDGDADTLAPLIIITPSNGTSVGLSANSLGHEPLFILGTAQDGPLDVLRPGARYSTQVAYKTPGETGFLSIEARPVQGDSTEQITDWSMIERALRPAGVEFAAWQQFWGRVQPRIGNTLGDLVGVLNDMAVRLSPAGDPMRDPRALFAAQFAADPDWTPSQPVSGVLLGANSGAAQAGVEVQVASMQGDRVRVEATTISAADGSFSFSRVRPGEYFLLVGGRQFDLDRDGIPDQSLPQLTVSTGAAPLVDTLYLYDEGLGDEINREDSHAELLTDTEGTVHAFWTRGDRLYHAWRDTDGLWQDARPVSDGVPGELAVAAGASFVDGQPGLIAVWSEGVDNDSELVYAVGRAKDGGGYEWSDPVRLTSNTVADVAPDVVVDGNGQAVITFLRRDFTIQDDSDLYYAVVDPDTQTLVWNDTVTFSAEVLDDAALAAASDLEPQLSQTYRFGYSKDLGEWNIAGFYVKAGFEGTLVATLDDVACETTVGGQVKGFADIKVANKGKVSGEAALYANAKWTVDPNTQDWKFAGANADFTGSVKYVWRDGIYDVMSFFPTLKPIAELLRQGQNFINKASGGAVRIQNGINIGPLGVEFKGMRWSADAPFPNFFMPQTLDSAAVSGSLGLWARAYSSYWGGIDLNLEGSIGLKATVYPGFKLEGTAQAAVTGKVGGWTIFNGEWQGSATLVEGADISAQANDPAPLLMLRWDPEATLGSTNVYGSGAVDAQVATNRLGDSPMVLARNGDGSVSGLFARDADAAAGEIGTELFITTLGASGWGDEVAIDGSLGFNGDGKLVTLADGRRVAVWTHASTAALDSSSTMEEIFAARDNNDVYYAIDDGNGFGTPIRLAATAGTDADLDVTTLADGSVAVAWTSTAADGTATLMTASIGEAGAGSVTEIASGLLSNVSITAAGNELVLSWDLDTDSTAEGTALEVHTASLVNGVLTSGGFDVAPLMAEFAKVLGASAEAAGSGHLDAQGLFPPFAVPEDCKTCTPERLKKLTEAAPDCRPGGGSETTLDNKKCEQKTITYAPCVTRPSDPNDIVGPDGYGDERWIKAADPLAYKIRFENQASATAPAQVVTITQTLDADLDARSFRITGFGFAEVQVLPSESRSFYSGRLDLRETQGIYLDVAARIDTTTRQITWTLTSIDPATGDVPIDASLGFLLPNDETGRGDGFVSYTVKPLRNVSTGAVVDAQARIVFDSEGPIDTPAIFHTLDAGGPSSEVLALPADSEDNSFVVRWAGTDATGGSAVRDYEVYVSIDGGAWALWQLATTDTEALYEGEPGHTYAFYSVARDNAGNVEAAPAEADAQVRVLAQTGSVAGTVFNDIDGDGVRDEDEAALAGWTVYLDADADGMLDGDELSVTTDDAGNWLFAELQPQVVRIALDTPADHLVTSPVAGYHDLAVVAGDVLSARDFGVLALGSIAGVQFDDLNGNGRQDDSEQGLAGWTIFIDGDGDSQLDADERHTVTAADGSYHFDRLRPGAYTIAQVVQDGWMQTRPGTAGSNSQTAFAVTLSGSLASISLPACACGGTVTTVAAQQSGWDEQLVELDALRADPGHAGVDGSGIRVVVIDTGIDATHPFFQGRVVYQYDFADNDSLAVDVNGHGTHVAGVIAGADAMFGGIAQGAELIVLKVFGNDGSGSFRNLERALQWVNNNAEAYNIGVVNLSLGDGGNWTDAGSRYGLGDEFAALAARNIISVAASGNNYAGVNALGVAYPGSDPAVLAVGAVWTGDFGGPWKFGNGGVDEATGEDRIASFSQRDPDQIDTFAPGARLTSAAVGGGVRTMQGTSQSAAYVSGVAALAQQLAREHLGRSLTVGEFRDLLVSTAVSINDGDDERDNVANSGLDFPRLDVKAMADAILVMAGSDGGGGTSPGDGTSNGGDQPTPVDPSAGGGGLHIDLAAGQQVQDADFGAFKLGRVGGSVFADLNGNGLRDGGEAGLAGATVFVDANANGLADDGETTVTTDTEGSWVLSNLLPGSLTLSTSLPGGWARTGAGSVTLDVTSGIEAEAHFGQQDITPVAQDDSVSTEQGRSVSGQVLANDSDPGRADNGLLVVSLVHGPAHGVLQLGADGAFTYTPDTGFEGSDSFTYAVSDGASSSQAVVHIGVAHDVLEVTQLTGRHDGFEVVFSRAIARSGLDVGGLAADVVVTNAAGQAVAGSLFIADDGRSARFLASGGVLADGSYSLRLRAGAQAFRDQDGVALNGGADPVNGSDALGQFTVARNNAVSVGLADTARGPGQRLGLGVNDTGLAVVLSQAAGVTELRFTLAYDPALLGVATLVRGSGLPASATFSVTELAPGRLAVSIGSASGLPSGALTLAMLSATVPQGVAYGAAQVIDVRDLLVNGGAIVSLDDDAVHVAAYPGDLDGDRVHSLADVNLLRGLLDGSSARLAHLPLVDAALLGDVNGSARFDAVDVLRLTQALNGSSGGIVAIPGATPVVVTPLPPVTVKPRPELPRPTPRAVPTPTWVTPLLTPSATIAANASIRVSL